MPNPSSNTVPFAPETLTEFDPRLIWEFQPEGLPPDRKPSGDLLAELINAGGQYEDVYLAYRYAEDHILPVIKEQGIEKITAEQFLEWLNQIHSRIAHTLAKNSEFEAGKYTHYQVMRWHEGAAMNVVMNSLLVQKDLTDFEFEQLISMNFQDEEKVRKLTNQQYRTSVITPFIDLLTKVAKDTSIPIPAVEADRISKLQIPGMEEPYNLLIIRFAGTGVAKLAVAYQTNRLTADEKAAVDRVVKICLPPEQMPAAMQAFAEKIVQAWKQCDPTDIDAVAKLAADDFSGITDIHSYGNGNGRAATCDMNIVLRSLGKPSILLRAAGEREDPNSAYSRAIAAIDSDPQRLIDHVKQRVLAEESKASENDSIESLEIETIRLYVQIKNLVLAIREIKPDCDLNSYCLDAAVKSNLATAQGLRVIFINPNSISEDELHRRRHASAKILCDSLSSLVENLQNPASSRSVMLKMTASSVVAKKYSPAEITEIKEQLSRITGKDNWNAYRTNTPTPVFLLTVSEKITAETYVEKFSQTGAVTAKLMRTPNTNNPVVQLEHVNLGKLRELTPFDGKPEEITSPTLGMRAAGAAAK